LIRPVRPNEVSCRINQCFEDKASFLLYIDSRACRNILDETFGEMGWQDTYQEIKGSLFCTIEIWDKDKQMWIKRQDCGTPSFAQKEKGEASDAFKRAAYSVGVARELYTKIPIFIELQTKNTGTKEKPKYEPRYKFAVYRVTRLEVNTKTRKITYLCITDRTGEKAFEWGFSNTPYINADVERAYIALVDYAEEFATLKPCSIESALKASLKGLSHDAEGYAKAIVLLKEKINEAKVSEESKDNA